MMTLEDWMHSGLPDQARDKGAQRAEARIMPSKIMVSNLTRATVLADRLEVADHSTNRRKGLLGRDGLAAGGGLWIMPCEAVHTFGMRFAIDLVYLDRKNQIRKVRSSVRPWRMSACLTASSVLELPAGTIAATGTRAGDLVRFSRTIES